MEKENKKAKAEETEVKAAVDKKKFIARKLRDINNMADKATAKALSARVLANK